jgi:hypothetical protein
MQKWIVIPWILVVALIAILGFFLQSLGDKQTEIDHQTQVIAAMIAVTNEQATLRTRLLSISNDWWHANTNAAQLRKLYDAVPASDRKKIEARLRSNVTVPDANSSTPIIRQNSAEQK